MTIILETLTLHTIIMHVSTSVMNKVRKNKNRTVQGVQNVTKMRGVRNSE